MNHGNKPLISIIVPIYNVEKYIDKCIKSLCNQTYKNIEIVLVNDGSKDNSLMICKSYAERDYRIKIVEKENGGLSDARNYGIDNSSGDYLIFVDGDDYIHCQMVEVLYEGLVLNEADIAICDFYKTLESDYVQDNILNIRQEITNVILYRQPEVMGEFFRERGLIFTIAWNKIYKKSLFKNVRYPVGKIHEDDFTTYKLIFNANRIIYINTKLYYYVQRDNSIMTEPFSIRRYHRVEAKHERAKFYIKNNIYITKAIETFLCEYNIYIQNYIKNFPDKIEEKKRYINDLEKECINAKKRLSRIQYMRIIFKLKYPKQYSALVKNYKNIKKCFCHK